MWTMRTILVLGSIAGCSGADQPPPPPPVTYGSAVISWSLVDEVGNPLNCGELGFTSASVRFGRDLVDVPCGDDQTVRFERVTPGQYGVTLSFDVSGRGSVLTISDQNLKVVADQEAELEIPVVIDQGSFDKGSIFFHWTIAGENAAANCGAFEVDRIHLYTTPSSFGQFDMDPDCQDGEVLVDALDPGIYEVFAEMLDAAGTRIGVPQRFQIRVGEAAQADQGIAFFQDPGDPASFHGLWSITSTSGPATCDEVQGDRVRISLKTIPTARMGVEIASATVACDAGQVTIENLLGGTNAVRATFVLISDFLGPLDTKTSTSFFLVSGRTATAAASFQVQ